MFLYETHAHTSPVSACAALSPAQQVRAYKKRGYAGIIVTDHFINGNSSCPHKLQWNQKMAYIAAGYARAKAEGDLCGLDVFFGWEYAIAGTEFLTYGLGLDFLLEHPGLDQLTVEQYSALIRQSGGYLAQAHPFRKAYWIAAPRPVEPSLIDGVEVYNASMPDSVNQSALDFAHRHGLPMQAGSDSHSEHLGFASGIALDKRAESISDIIKAIQTKRANLILPDGFGHGLVPSNNASHLKGQGVKR